MSGEVLKGRVHSIQSLGTLDGPGVRFVVFLKGCNLRCGCCHNPDTWDLSGGREYTSEEIVKSALRYTEYFGRDGGITLSGGEPLVQAKFAAEVFKICRQKGIDTCLDTSGSIMNNDVLKLLEFTDRVLLDIKYTDDESYKKYVGCEIYPVLGFLKLLEEKNIPTVIRQVTIPSLNDTDENILRLKDIVRSYKNVEKAELLPFKKICEVKYRDLNIEFPFADIPTPSREKMEYLRSLL